MKVLHVASEMFPLLKTGGLADVIGALPYAQLRSELDVRVLLPAYPAVMSTLSDKDNQLVASFDTFAGQVNLRYIQYAGLGLYLLDAPHLFSRQGNPYHDANYRDYADNFLRFALLGYVGAEIASGRDDWWRPDVVHAHDWHAGLTCAYLKARQSSVKSVFTIHNIAYQGLFSAHHLSDIQLPQAFFSMEGLEFNGQLSYLKAGIYYADQVTTVSPTFAREITRESHAFGLHGLLQTLAEQGRLHGVLNGLDESIWHPATDTLLPARFKVGAIQGKGKNKSALQRHFHLPDDKRTLLFVMVTRLTEQKGVDIFLDSLMTIIKEKEQLIVLGSGSPQYEASLLALAEKYPEQVGVLIGYDENLAHLVIAGGDVIVIPSRFEPCGLTQLYGLKYGTLPLVHRTGGLADTVTDTNDETFKRRTATGFVFDDISAKSLSGAIRRAFTLWNAPRKWNNVRANAMREKFDWQMAAEQYSELYKT